MRFLIIGLLFATNICVGQDKFEAFFPDVEGHQSGGLLKFPGSRCILYDIGTGNIDGPTRGRVTRNFAQGISDFITQEAPASRVLDIIVSHPNVDAFNLIEQIITDLPRVTCPGFTLGNVILGGDRNNYLDTHGVSRIDFIEQLAIQHNTPALFTKHPGTQAGYHISLAQLHCMPGISPANDVINILDYSKISPNSESNYQNLLVKLNLNYNIGNQFSFLLPGGMQDDTKGRGRAQKAVGGRHIYLLEQLANNQGFVIQSDGYVSAHHAGAVSIDTKHYWQQNLVRPKFIFCLNDRNNTLGYGHPRRSALDTALQSQRLLKFGNHRLTCYDNVGAQVPNFHTRRAIFSTRDQHNMKFVLRNNAAIDDYLLSPGGAALPYNGQWCSKNIVVDVF